MFAESVDERPANAPGEQRRSGKEGGFLIAGSAGTAILRLKEIDVAAPCDVVRVLRVAGEGSIAARQWPPASADATRQRQVRE
jgi:hypothetical protein